jgi:hypothetical protein
VELTCCRWPCVKSVPSCSHRLCCSTWLRQYVVGMLWTPLPSHPLCTVHAVLQPVAAEVLLVRRTWSHVPDLSVTLSASAAACARPARAAALTCSGLRLTKDNSLSCKPVLGELLLLLVLLWMLQDFPASAALGCKLVRCRLYDALLWRPSTLWRGTKGRNRGCVR